MLRTAIVVSGVLALTLFMLSCGGGSGSSFELIEYVGLQEQAVIHDGNAEPLSIWPYLFANISDSPIALFFHDHNPQTGKGICSGTYAYGSDSKIDTHDHTYKFIITYEDFSGDCEQYVTGKIFMTGKLDEYDDYLLTGHVQFGPFFQENPYSAVTMSGEWHFDDTANPYREWMDIVIKDELSGKTYWLDGIEVQISYDSDVQGDHMDVSLSGRYYDPDNGFVELDELQSVRLDESSSWPVSGTLGVSGANTTSTLLEAFPLAEYEVLADTDGDLLKDDFNSGTKRWPSANQLPVVVTGQDQEVIVGCPFVLDGTGTYDPEGDEITYNWSILSAPPGNSVVITTDDLIDMEIVPNVAGSYIFQLQVTDSFGGISSEITTMSVLPGQFCTSTFIEGTSTGSFGGGMDLADMNGDGRTDIVVFAEDDNRTGVYIHYQDISGMFESSPQFLESGTSGSRLYALIAGDFDSNGLQDIAISGADEMDVFYQTAVGAFGSPMSYESLQDQAYSVITTTEYLKAGDFNGDGKTDIFRYSMGPIQPENSPLFHLEVFLQDDMSALYYDNARSFTSTRIGGVVVTDLNSDGNSDVVFSSYTSFIPNPLLPPYIGVLSADAQGQLSLPEYHLNPTGARIYSLAGEDLNQDGRDDLTISTYDSEGTQIGVYFQNHTGTLDSISFYQGQIWNGGLAIADFDEDGINEIVSGPGPYRGGTVIDRYLEIYHFNADRSLRNIVANKVDVGFSALDFKVGDLNSNGRKDLVMISSGWDISIFYNKLEEVE